MSDTPTTVDWPSLARTLYREFGDSAIETTVRRCLDATTSSRVLVACSGGADSVLMLCLLYARSEQTGLPIEVAHYNHRWRAEASNADAEFVRHLAKGLGLAFHYSERPHKEAAFTETTARELRLGFLRSVAAAIDANIIAFGHQLDDILETQLQRLARGCGSDGLAAPRPVSHFVGRPSHVRPLLGQRSGDIRMALHANGIPWCEDFSNEDVRIARNALRHDVIPELFEALDRDPATGAARSRKLLEEDATALDTIARERVPEAFKGEASLDRATLCQLPKALVRRVLTAWLSEQAILSSVSAPAMELLIAGVLGSVEKDSFSAGKCTIRVDGKLIWIDAPESPEVLEHCEISPGEAIVLSDGSALEASVVTLTAADRERVLGGQVDPAIEAYLQVPSQARLKVRPWQPGDRYKPIGAPGNKKLKDWFINRHVPRKERKWLPLVTMSGGEIIWLPGFPPADRMKIDSGTKQALRLTYRPSNSR